MSFKDMGKPDSAKHLTPVQVRSVVDSISTDLPAHLKKCLACSEMVRQLRLISHRPAFEFGGCIPHERLLQFAGRQHIPETAELSHLADCGKCSARLRELSADFDDALPEEIAGLVSSSPKWHASMARKIAAAKPAKQRLSILRPKWAFAVAAVAAVLIFGIVIRLTRTREDKASGLLARAFEKHRLTSMRMAGAHYSPLAVTRSTAPAIGDMPSEALDAAALARRNLERTASDPYWHSVQGDVYLLQGEPERAANEYRISEAADPSNASYRLSLGSALCDGAIQRGLPGGYSEGLNALRGFVAGHETNSVALYNLGVCLYHAGLFNEAKKYLQQAAGVERDSSWLPEIQQLLNNIDAKLRANSGRSIPDFGWQAPPGAQHNLVAAIEQNHIGNSAEALSQARSAERLATRAANRELLLWAKFEQAYALQRLSKARECRGEAESALSFSPRPSLKDLQAALLTEAGICSEILGDFRAAEAFYLRGQQVAVAPGAASLRLRIAGMRAALYNSEGRHRESERLDLEAITGNSETLNPMRRYQFLSDLYFNAVAQRYFFAALEFEGEALHYGSAAGNMTIAAASHEDLAEACLRISDHRCAKEEEERASSLLKNFDPGTRQLYAITWSLRRELIAPGTEELLESLPVAKMSEPIRRNHYLGLPLLLLESNRAYSAGEFAKAEARALAAAYEVTRLRRNLSDGQARFAWLRDARPVFELLVQARLAKGDPRGALDCWESFRSLLRTPESQICGLQDRSSPANGFVVVFARLRDSYVQWVLSPGGTLEQRTLVSADRIEGLARLLLAMCSQSGTAIESNAGISEELSNLLIPSVVTADASAPIVFEPDDLLAELPYRALRHGGQWLGLSRAVSIVPGLWAIRNSVESHFENSRLLLIGSSADGRVGFESEHSGAAAAGYQIDRIENFFDISSRIDEAHLVYYVGHASEREAMQAALALPRKLRVCRLVILAACRTRGGGRTEFEAFGILPDRLLEAGALEVVASRWDLDSQPTEQLLQPFLASSPSYPLAEQLRTASVELANHGYPHPYYWAGLDVYGVSVVKKGGQL